MGRAAATAFIVLIGAASAGAETGPGPAAFVDPFIGTANRANNNPGAVVPWGMVTVSPSNIRRELGPSSGPPSPYEAGRPHLYGFTHVASSGIGCHESGDVTFMATTGALDSSLDGRRSEYSGERAEPGYYEVRLDRWGTRVQATATLRTGITRFTFPGGPAHVLLDLGFAVDHVKEGLVRIVSDREVEGVKDNGVFCGFAGRRQTFFVARFSRPSSARRFLLEGAPLEPGPKEVEGLGAGAYFTFETGAGEAVELVVGISFVSIANARLNLEREQPAFAFEATRARALERWNEELGRFRVEGGTPEQRTLFYTALYHSLLLPHVFDDANGDYAQMGGGGGRVPEGHHRYTVYSLWDTYRTLHPLLALAYPRRQLDMVRSMVGMSREHGWLPLWELRGMETFCMIGDPALPVIADTWVKGLRDFDVEAAYEAMVKNASLPPDGKSRIEPAWREYGPGENPIRPALGDYLELGYVPHELEQGRYRPYQDRTGLAWGTVSTTLEYAHADWALAQVAAGLGRTADHDRFQARSLGYRKLFDPESGFLRSRRADGSWLEDFDPLDGFRTEGVTIKDGVGYCEGSAWQYAFFAPHDMAGLVELLGGAGPFATKLQRVFDDGYFDMTNEPDIAYPFLFNYAPGEEWRTRPAVRGCVESFFGTGPDGLPGNDDAGTLSAWLVFAMVGLYPDCPGSEWYQISGPLFDRVEIDLDAAHYPGRRFVVRTEGEGDLITGITLDGRPHEGYRLSHRDLVRGGEMVVRLGARRAR